jgi:hypothetical protein
MQIFLFLSECRKPVGCCTLSLGLIKASLSLMKSSNSYTPLHPSQLLDLVFYIIKGCHVVQFVSWSVPSTPGTQMVKRADGSECICVYNTFDFEKVRLAECTPAGISRAREIYLFVHVQASAKLGARRDNRTQALRLWKRHYTNPELGTDQMYLEKIKGPPDNLYCPAPCQQMQAQFKVNPQQGFSSLTILYPGSS